jgi:hypothetical protein
MDQVLSPDRRGRSCPPAAITGQQLLDGRGGLPVQLALALQGGQATDLGRDVGRRAADGPAGVDDHDHCAQGVQRPGSTLAAGRGRERAERQVDQAYDGAMRTPSSATGWSPS